MWNATDQQVVYELMYWLSFNRCFRPRHCSEYQAIGINSFFFKIIYLWYNWHRFFISNREQLERSGQNLIKLKMPPPPFTLISTWFVKLCIFYLTTYLTSYQDDCNYLYYLKVFSVQNWVITLFVELKCKKKDSV